MIGPGHPPAHKPPRQTSLRRRLLLGILLPVALLIAFNTASLYRQALAAVNTAYDRTLLASAKLIGEQLDVTGYDDAAVLSATVSYAALEAFEADNRSQLVYRVSNLQGDWVSGFTDLQAWHGQIPVRPPYAALVDFYQDRYRNLDVRVAVLLQPVASPRGRAMAVVQVAETLELRETLARKILLDTLLGQGALVGVMGGVIVLVVQRATRPIRTLGAQLRARPEHVLTPLEAPGAPRELIPLVDATNALMGRMRDVLDHQKRFVRDAAHQLRTPLTVLKVQVQSALRGDVDAPTALREIDITVDRATLLAQQMLALAKVEQLRQQSRPTSVVDVSAVARAVALDLSALIAQRDLHFSIAGPVAWVHADEWMVRELVRNLMHNAIRHSPVGGALTVAVLVEAPSVTLRICDDGPGIADALAERLFQPFSTGGAHGGAGLGLVIAREIAEALGGTVELRSRHSDGPTVGAEAFMRLPSARGAAPAVT